MKKIYCLMIAAFFSFNGFAGVKEELTASLNAVKAVDGTVLGLELEDAQLLEKVLNSYLTKKSVLSNSSLECEGAMGTGYCTVIFTLTKKFTGTYLLKIRKSNESGKIKALNLKNVAG